MRRIKFTPAKLLLSYLFFFASPSLNSAWAQDQFVYQNQPLKQVIEDIENREGYRFLYRDALIADKRVTLEASSDSLISSLKQSLLFQRMDLKVDLGRKQILLSEAQPGALFKPSIINGQILDSDSGARLPFANITWIHDGQLHGVSTNEAGVFHMQVNEKNTNRESVLLAVSYVGYRSTQIQLDLANPPSELSIRLIPERIQGQEVLVQSALLHTDLDTTWHHLLYAGLFSPFGESSILRSLQPLPAVAVSNALSEGLNVRGSKADGFQVLLDGAPIYNQNHFYGMFDVFNEDALQTVGFYYDIAPASYFAPPGGTISFITRTGSLTDFNASVGLSSTAFRGTFEGPFAKGRASWLISGRHSYLDRVNWLNNQNLLGLGLDVDRTISQIPTTLTDSDDFFLRPRNSQARFFDVHGKTSIETKRGGRATLSLYAGGNDTEFSADRLTLVRREENGTLRPGFEPVTTANVWGNQAASLQFQDPLGARSFLQTVFSISHYSSRFDKDDLTYTRINPNTGRTNSTVAPFSYKNELLDAKWAHHLSVAPRHPGLWSFGISGNFYALNYQEVSAIRPAFDKNYFAIKGDAYGEYELKDARFLNVRSGLRLHYFTQGHAFRLSPRFQLTFFPRAAVTARVGYSRNYQFLHQLFLDNTNSASMWIITTGARGPSSVDNLTAGLYFKPGPSFAFQVEAYDRSYNNLRGHEINAPALVNTANASSFVPWISNTKGFAQGIEFMYNQSLGFATWTNSYTLSKVELQNDLAQDGARYPAEWDRRHQFSSNVQIFFTPTLSAILTWYYASGNANVLAYVESEHTAANQEPEKERLPDYHRLDASIKAVFNLSRGSQIEARASLYNVYNQINVWYREPIQVILANRPGSGLQFYNVDVFDLAVQPAFDLSITF